MHSNLKAYLVAGFLFVASIAIAFFAIHGGTFKFEFTTEQAQERVNESLKGRAFDISEKTVHVGQEVVIESATVRFANDKVFIDAAVHGRVKKYDVRADVHAVGKPSYRDGAIYFEPSERPRFENMEMVRVTDEPGRFTKTLDAVKKHAEEVLVKRGWDDVAQNLKEDFKKWTTDFAEKRVESALTKHPIYRPKADVKGFVVRSALDKIEVINDQLVVTLSVTQVAYSIFIAIVSLLGAIALLFALAHNPEWLLAFALFS